MQSDHDILYDIKVMQPGTWPNVAAPTPDLTLAQNAVVDSWVDGFDRRHGLVIHGGTAPDREGLGIHVLREVKELLTGNADAFVWSEFDFSDNFRMLRSLEDFAKKDRDPETWNLYVEYERKFYRLMSRELVFFQGLLENRSVFDHHREFLHNEIVRRLTQNQYDSPRLTIVSTPDLDAYRSVFPAFYEYLADYCAVVSLGPGR